MKTLLLLMLMAVSAEAQVFVDSILVLDGKLPHSTTLEYKIFQPGTIWKWAEEPLLEPTSKNVKATKAVYSLWDGFRLGAELVNRFNEPYKTEFAAYGNVRFNLTQDISAGLKVSFGTTDVVWRLNLERKVF